MNSLPVLKSKLSLIGFSMSSFVVLEASNFGIAPLIVGKKNGAFSGAFGASFGLLRFLICARFNNVLHWELLTDERVINDSSFLPSSISIS